MRAIELEYTERLCYYVHGVRIENTPLPCLPAQANRAGRKANAAPTFSYESSVSPISMPFLQVRFTGFRDRPLHERQAKFQHSLREGNIEMVSTGIYAFQI